ncbi:hypothetical protein DY000_02031355 [Brassica cretica]|uniref:Uncharacterized protein n=1 Tax=Brassica cretica TaxID=69181 RepID=A0ABQ7DJB1_BRACR|nr:hypothetical protein DY000_02031355 [Brassica cretica]
MDENGSNSWYIKDFDLIIAGLRSECVLPSFSTEPVGQDPVAEDAGGSMALNPDVVIGEGMAVFYLGTCCLWL